MKSTNLKFIASLFFVMLLSTMFVIAQNNSKPTPAERAEKRTEKMTEKLELDNYQIQIVSDLNLSYSQAMADLKDQDLEKQERKEAAKALKENYRTEMENVLTPEQFEKFKKTAKRKRGKRKGKRGGNKADSQE